MVGSNANNPEMIGQPYEYQDPDKLDIILRQHGYGLPGENIYRFKVPEPVTPLDETLKSKRSKGLLEYVVEFIVGTNSD